VRASHGRRYALGMKKQDLTDIKQALIVWESILAESRKYAFIARNTMRTFIKVHLFSKDLGTSEYIVARYIKKALFGSFLYNLASC